MDVQRHSVYSYLVDEYDELDSDLHRERLDRNGDPDRRGRDEHQH
jgi:hypothetical protein